MTILFSPEDKFVSFNWGATVTYFIATSFLLPTILFILTIVAFLVLTMLFSIFFSKITFPERVKLVSQFQNFCRKFSFSGEFKITFPVNNPPVTIAPFSAVLIILPDLLTSFRAMSISLPVKTEIFFASSGNSIFRFLVEIFIFLIHLTGLPITALYCNVITSLRFSTVVFVKVVFTRVVFNRVVFIRVVFDSVIFVSVVFTGVRFAMISPVEVVLEDVSFIWVVFVKVMFEFSEVFAGEELFVIDSFEVLFGSSEIVLLVLSCWSELYLSSGKCSGKKN